MPLQAHRYERVCATHVPLLKNVSKIQLNPFVHTALIKPCEHLAFRIVKEQCSSQRSPLHGTTRVERCIHATDRRASSRTQMVEVNGIEPMTSCLQSRRPPN